LVPQGLAPAPGGVLSGKPFHRDEIELRYDGDDEVVDGHGLGAPIMGSNCSSNASCKGSPLREALSRRPS